MKRESPRSLYDLVKSLTPGEKRDVVAYASRFNKEGEQAHLKLIDFLYDQPEYDEEPVKKEFAAHNLPRLKIYARRSLIRALQVLGKENHYAVKAIIGQVEIAIDRGAYHDAHRLILDGKETAGEKELFLLWIQLFRLERKVILKIFANEERGEKLEANRQEMAEVVTLNKNYEAFLALRYQYYEPAIVEYLAIGQRPEPLINQLVKEPLLETTKNAKSVRAKVEFLTFWRYHHVLKKEWEKALDQSLKFLELIHHNPWLEEGLEKEVVQEIKEVYGFFSLLKKPEKAKEYLTLLKLKADQTTVPNWYLIEKLLLCQLDFTIVFRDPEPGSEAFAYIEKHIEDLEKHLGPKGLLRVYYWSLLYLMRTRDFDPAFKMIQRVMAIDKLIEKVDLQVYLRVFHFIILFEQNDHVGLTSFGQNYSRFLNKQKPVFEIAKAIVNALRKFHTYTLDSTRLRNLLKLQKTIQELAKDPVQGKAMDYMDFENWIAEVVEKYQPNSG